MKRALVIALVLSLTALADAAGSAAKPQRKDPAAIKKQAGPNRVGCPASARRVKVGKNPQRVIDAAGRGGSVCFEPGTYRLRSPLRPRARQVLTFKRGAILSGTSVLKTWEKSGDYWVAGGQRQSFDVPASTGAPICNSRPGACIFEDVYINDKPLRHVRSRSELGPGRVYFDKAADKIYIAQDPSGHTVEATVAERAIESAGHGVTIRGATIEKFAFAGITIYKHDNWTISHSVIRHVHLEGIGIYTSQGHVVTNNHVHHNGIIGMAASGVQNLTVRRSEFAHNNYLRAGPPHGHHEGSIKILFARDVVIRSNWSHHNYGDGLWFDFDNRDILIENNLLERNTRHGLHYEASFDATVRYNTIRHNGRLWQQEGAGIYNSTSKNVKYIRNRIANNEIRSIVIVWQDRGRSDNYGERQSANLLFRRNVIVLHNNFQSWVGVYWEQNPRVFTSNNRFEANTYLTPTNPERENGLWWRWGEKDLNWAQWRAYGFDLEGTHRRIGEPPRGKVVTAAST